MITYLKALLSAPPMNLLSVLLEPGNSYPYPSGFCPWRSSDDSCWLRIRHQCQPSARPDSPYCWCQHLIEGKFSTFLKSTFRFSIYEFQIEMQLQVLGISSLSYNFFIFDFHISTQLKFKNFVISFFKGVIKFKKVLPGGPRSFY